MKAEDFKRPDKEPASAPPVPKELLSARPAMTKVVPRQPDAVEAASQATDEDDAPPENPEDRQERIDYLRNLNSDSPKKSGGKKWIFILLIVVLLAVAAGAYWFFAKHSSSTPKKPTTATQSTTQATPETTDQTTANFKDYQSSNFTVSLKYPSDWQISDTAAALTITSPSQQLTSGSGAKAGTGVVVTIKNPQTSIPEFKGKDPAAVLESDKIAYSTPATGQRASTYLSFLQYASTTAKGSLDTMYITGNSGYQKGQNVPQADVIKVDPSISIHFVTCTSACSPTGTATNVSSTEWSGSLKTDIETIIKSLAVS